MYDFIVSIFSNPPLVFVGVLGTVGWIYTARRNRILSRKQHTFNALLKTSCDGRYLNALEIVRPHMREGRLPRIDYHDKSDLKHERKRSGKESIRLELRKHVNFLLNHYEFLAAGVRLGDIDERLLQDSEKGTIIRLFSVSEKFIDGIRDKRERNKSYEHIEWLAERWTESNPSTLQRFLEWLLARPMYYPHHYRIWLIGSFVGFLSVLVMYFHYDSHAMGMVQSVKGNVSEISASDE